MKILVLIKQTFDTEEEIIIKQGMINEENLEFIINPYDEYAIEEAIRIKEEIEGEVTVATVGPARAESSLRSALAMGADRAILIEEESISSYDEYSIAKVLAAVAQREPYELILAGYMAVDGGSAQVGPRVAEELNIPQVSTITKLKLNGNTIKAEKDAEGDVEIIESTLPILLTTQQGLNEPRYPSLPGIMKAKKKPLERLSIDDLGIQFDEIKPKTEMVDQFLPTKKGAGKILIGESREQVIELIHLLHGEAKVI